MNEDKLATLKVWLERALVAGNHCASFLADKKHPPHTATLEEGMEFFQGDRNYDVWVCWRELMQIGREYDALMKQKPFSPSTPEVVEKIKKLQLPYGEAVQLTTLVEDLGLEGALKYLDPPWNPENMVKKHFKILMDIKCEGV